MDVWDYCVKLCEKKYTEDCVDQVIIQDTERQKFKLVKRTYANYYSCRFIFTTAKGLLKGTKQVDNAEECRQECKKTEVCVQWEWRDKAFSYHRCLSKFIALYSILRGCPFIMSYY